MGTVAPTFFVSYRREDAGYAEALRVSLIARYGADQVFKDVDSMALGSSWKEQVIGAIDRSTHVLALIGDGWMDGVDDGGCVAGHADPVVFELEEALRQNVSIVPVLVGGRQMPEPDELPALLRLHDFRYLNAARIRAESPGPDIDTLTKRFAERERLWSPASRRVHRWLRAPGRRSISVLAATVALAALGGVAVLWLVNVFDDNPTGGARQEPTGTGLAVPSEDGHPACAEPTGPDWHPIALGDDPTGRVEDQANSLSFEVNDANWRSLGAQAWQVVLDMAMTNGTTNDLQHGSWYYEHLEVARRPFELSCISLADVTFVRPGLISDGRVGFTVRCEPVGAIRLVVGGADSVTDAADTIEVAGGPESEGC